jgi:hypothetical protein
MHCIPTLRQTSDQIIHGGPIRIDDLIISQVIVWVSTLYDGHIVTDSPNGTCFRTNARCQAMHTSTSPIRRKTPVQTWIKKDKVAGWTWKPRILLSHPTLVRPLGKDETNFLFCDLQNKAQQEVWTQ